MLFKQDLISCLSLHNYTWVLLTIVVYGFNFQPYKKLIVSYDQLFSPNAA